MEVKTEFQAVDHNQIILISEDGSAVLVTPGRCVQLQVVTNAVLNAEDEPCEIEVIPLTEGGASVIRGLIITIFVIALFIFLASLGGGLGYASAGGEVRILSTWSEAHSESGQAIAVVGDDNHLNANNTPTPAKPQTRNSPTDMLLSGFFLVALAILGLWLWSNGFFSSYGGGDIGGHSSSSNYKSNRRYGPE